MLQYTDRLHARNDHATLWTRTAAVACERAQFERRRSTFLVAFVIRGFPCTMLTIRHHSLNQTVLG